MTRKNHDVIPEAGIARGFEEHLQAYRAMLHRAYDLVQARRSSPDQRSDAQLLPLGRKLVEQSDTVILLPIEERGLYDSVMARFRVLEDRREQALSVLEWLVFPEDAAPPTTRWVKEVMMEGWDWKSHQFDPVEDMLARKNGGTRQAWREFWSRTPYLMASSWEFAQAERSLYAILSEKPSLYTDEEREKALAMQRKISEAIERASSGLVLDISICLRPYPHQNDVSSATVQYPPGRQHTALREITLPDHPQPLYNIERELSFSLFRSSFFDAIPDVGVPIAATSGLIPGLSFHPSEPEKRKKNQNCVLNIFRQPVGDRYIIGIVPESTTNQFSLGINEAVYKQYHGEL
ncbi:hypothetical protein HYS47_05450 [Candidatus Woesearchaeota archaeon]|nr:hypothetical protein [Candidatus Woesearchaeota archaeon]